MADKYTQDFIDEVKGCLNSGSGSFGGKGSRFVDIMIRFRR